MILTLTFKTPDVAEDELRDIGNESERAHAAAVIAKFVRYGEYVSIQIDTETEEATVLPA